MKFTTIIALFAGAAAAAPAVAERQAKGPKAHEVQIRGFTHGGSGCPAGSVGHMLSSDLTTLTLIYDEFIAQAGKDIKPIEKRKNCQVNLKVQYPQGWQFSIFKADYRGHATLPAGATGTCKATYYFSGSSQQISNTKKFTGPYDADYLKTDVFGLESIVWSPCGVEGLINVNSAIQVNPLDLEKPALMTSESTDFTFKQVQYLQWRQC
ncbi:hypothetical protein B0J13DRAFT_473868 [Dactylonectria estremocensis]|uniref:Secreted protein n=1 Tax=Dactylonectria estremocensis TaxID=1079267 RepID=A0A9P9EYQ8_9HYPO|nr:hypothetical protein B0J13DRAFT_473868 [Dactylonectria estremocensis]